MMKRRGDKQEPIGDRHLVAGPLGKVIALATRLQMTHEDQQKRSEESLSIQQVEAIGRELNLDPSHVREAIAQLERQRPRNFPSRRALREVDSVVAAFGLAAACGVLSAIFRSVPGFDICFSLIVPVPLSVLIGYLAGKKEIATLATTVLILTMMPAWHYSLFYLGVGYFIARRLGEQGVLIHDHLGQTSTKSGELSSGTVTTSSQSASSSSRSGSGSREALLAQIFELHQQLESRKQHLAFLSVDVVGSSDMAQSGSELAVEYSFNEFRRWVERLVQIHTGEVQGTAGDGFMCVFPNDALAVRAALRLQQGIVQFNLTHNRLPQPFRIRCGLSAGEVAIDEGTPLREVQNPVVYRAARVQKRAEPGGIAVSPELESVACAEIGALGPGLELQAAPDITAWSPSSPPLDIQQGNR